MMNQTKTNPNPDITKYTHKYAIPTNIPPSTQSDPSYESYPLHSYPSVHKTTTTKQPQQNQIRIQEGYTHQNWDKKLTQPQMEQLQNENTLAKLLMFDSIDLASRQNNNTNRAASSHYYSINEGNSSNGEKSLNISNAVKYVNSRYEPYSSQNDHNTTGITPILNKQQNRSTSYQPHTMDSNNIQQSSSVYPNINNLPLLQSQYQQNYPDYYQYSNNQSNKISNPQQPKYQSSKQSKQPYTSTSTSTTPKYNQLAPLSPLYPQPHQQKQNNLQLSSSSHNRQYEQQSEQSQDVLYTFLIKFINILNNKIRAQSRYPFEALYLNYKFKPFNPTPITTPQQNGIRQNKNNNSPTNKNNNININQQTYQMQYTYAIPTDTTLINTNNPNIYPNNRLSNSVNTYTYSHTSGEKSVSLSGNGQDKMRDRYQKGDADKDSSRQKDKDKELQSIPSHALSSISSIDQQGNIHNISYPYNVSTSMNENNLHEFSHRKHIMAIEDNSNSNTGYFGYETYPVRRQSPKTKSTTHSNTNKITNTKSLNLQKTPYNQTHPPHQASNPQNHHWQQHNNSPTFHKIIQEEEQQSNTNTNSNIGSSLHGGSGVVSEFQFNGNLKVKSKGKNANMKKKIDEVGYLYKDGVQARGNPQVRQNNGYQNINQLSPSKPLYMQIAVLSTSPKPFPKADKNIQLPPIQKDLQNVLVTFGKKQPSNKNTPCKTPAKLQPLSIDPLIIDTLQQTSRQPALQSHNSNLDPIQQPHQPYLSSSNSNQQEQYNHGSQSQHQNNHPQQNIYEQDHNNRQYNPSYNLQNNSRNNTNNNNSNSKSNSNNSSNQKNNIGNYNPHLNGIVNNIFKPNTNYGEMHKNNIHDNISNIKNINTQPQSQLTTNLNSMNPTTPIYPPHMNPNMNINMNTSNSDKIIQQQQPVYIDVGQPVNYQKILMNNQNIGRSISSYIESNIFDNNSNLNVNKQQRYIVVPQRRGQSRDRPLTYSPTPLPHYQNIPMPIRPTSNVQVNTNLHVHGHDNPQILLKYPHIVVAGSPRNSQNPIVSGNKIPIRFNSVSPPPKNERILSQNKYPQIKIFQEAVIQQPKQIFVTFNQDSSTRRPVSQPSPRPVSGFNAKPVIMPVVSLQQMNANLDHRKLVEVRADYYGHDVRAPGGNIVINNKVVRQVSPVLKDVRSSPHLPRINVMPDMNSQLNNARIRNTSPTQPQGMFVLPNKVPIPQPTPIPHTSPKKTEQISSVHSSLQSNKLSIHQPRPQSALVSTTPINTLKQVPFVLVEDVPSKNKTNTIINNQTGGVPSQRQLQMDQTIINKLDGSIQEKTGSKTNIANGSSTYIDYYEAPRKQRQMGQQTQHKPQLLKNSEYTVNVEPSPFIKAKQPFNFQTSPSSSPKHILHNSPQPNIRPQPQPNSPHPQQKSPEPLHPLYRDYHDAASSRPGSNRKKLNLVSKEQGYESKVSQSRDDFGDY